MALLSNGILDLDKRGGILCFLIANMTAGCNVHARMATAAKLNISSHLLSVARSVVESP